MKLVEAIDAHRRLEESKGRDGLLICIAGNCNGDGRGAERCGTAYCPGVGAEPFTQPPEMAPLAPEILDEVETGPIPGHSGPRPAIGTKHQPHRETEKEWMIRSLREAEKADDA